MISIACSELIFHIASLSTTGVQAAHVSFALKPASGMVVCLFLASL